jgi:hypothetical protein
MKAKAERSIGDVQGKTTKAAALQKSAGKNSLEISDNREVSASQTKLQMMVDRSPRMTVQRTQIDRTFDTPVQRLVESTETLSYQSAPVQRRTLSDNSVAKAALGIVRADAPTFGHVHIDKWMNDNAQRRIKWELTKEESDNADAQDKAAVIDWVREYAKLFKNLTDLYTVVGMLASAAGEKGASYEGQIKAVKWHPTIKETKPPTIVFGPAPSRGFYEGKTHSIQIDLFKHDTALEVLDTIMFESINAARTQELNKDIEGIEEYDTDIAHVERLKVIYACDSLTKLCQTLGVTGYMTKADENSSVKKGYVEMPSRDKVGNQAARQALWHWKTEDWSVENKKCLWGASPHAPNMPASVVEV